MKGEGRRGKAKMWTGNRPEKTQQPGISTYPNPNSGRFTVEGSGFSGAYVDIIVFNLNGQQVFRSIVITVAGWVKSEIDLEDLAAGLYFLRVVSAGEVVMRKILIE